MHPIHFIFIFLLIGFTHTACAEWTPVTKTYQSKGYADFNSLQKRGDVTSMNVLIDYEKPPFDGNNLSYRSLKQKAEYNCATKQFRTLELTSYANNMGKGHRPYHASESSEWQAVQAKSIQEDFWKAACKKYRAPK